MIGKFKKQLKDELVRITDAGLYKKERVITKPQSTEIEVITGEKVLNFCANNYLGLSSHPDVVQDLSKTYHPFYPLKIQFYMQQHLMLMEDYSSLYLEKKMRLSQTP